MPLTNYEEFGFRLNYALQFYLWPFPLRWKNDYSGMELNKSKRKLSPFKFIMIYMLLLGILCYHTVIYYTYFKPNPQLDITKRLIFCVFGGWALFICVLVFVAKHNIKEILGFLNGMIKLGDEIITEYPDQQNILKQYRKSFELDAIFAFVVVPFAFIMTLLVPIIVEMVDIDPMYFILEDLLPDPMYRNSFTIHASLLGRMAYCTLGTAEAARIIVTLIGTGFMALKRIEKFDEIGTSKIKLFRRFHYYYTCLIVNYRRIEAWLGLLVHLGFSGVFWVTVANCWVVFRGSPATGTNITVYITCIVIFALFVLVHIVLLPYICNLIEGVLKMMKMHAFRAKVKSVLWKTRGNKMELKQAKSLFPFRIKFGVYWFLGKALVPEYLYLLQLRCIDTILMTN